MTTGTTTLTAWLLEQIAADEAVARASAPTYAEGEPWDAKDVHDRQWHTNECGWRTGEGIASACECGVPARVLATCAAHRAIIGEFIHAGDVAELEQEGDQLDTALDFWQRESALEDAVKALAGIYRDRPGYDPDWA